MDYDYKTLEEKIQIATRRYAGWQCLHPMYQGKF